MSRSHYVLFRRVAATVALGTGLTAAAAAGQEIPAFPGADGAAAHVTGGRGGSVYKVTRLDAHYQDTAPGTLRYGLDNNNFPAGPRTIVFDVGGVINLGRVVSGWDPNGNGWDTTSRLNIPSNVTVAGQTAPGGVTLMGGMVKAGGNNMILRNFTIAPGYGTRGWYQPGDAAPRKLYPDSYVYDAVDISGQNLMISHLTTVYATDETISANEMANNVTIQYSNISQGQNYPQADAEASGTVYTGHALGSLLQAGSNAKISVHHNLYAHQKGRLPRVGTEASKLTVPGEGAHNDFRNNVFYNWLSTAGTGASNQPSRNKFVNNYYLAGPGGDDAAGGASTDIVTRAGGTGIFNGSNSTGTRVFHSGNFKDVNKNGTAEFTVALTNSDFGSSNFVADDSFSVPYVGVTDTASNAFERVLNYAGARWWERDDVIDTIDERIIHEVRTGTGKIRAWADDPYNDDPNEGTEWRAMKNAPAQSRPAGWDTDNDGMPNEWELAHGLLPDVADHNGDFDGDGYTNLEEYLNEIAAWPAPKPLIFTAATNGRYEQITNWDVPWQPSRYDEAQINAGTVTVNSVGQHAGVLKVAANAGNVATLYVSDGWINVAQDLLVGPAGKGKIEQSGGVVRAGRSVVLGGSAGAEGVYHLSGGTLITPLLEKGASGGEFLFTGGKLHAQEIRFDLVNAGGVLAPGTSIGHTHVAGSLALEAGAIEIELASDSNFDTISVAGNLTLGGDLLIDFLDGYEPHPDDRWLIMSAGSVSGNFASVPEGFTVETNGGNVILVAVPEPATLLLAPAGAAMLLRRRRRR